MPTFLVHRGGTWIDFLLEIGEVPFIVTITHGRVSSVERGALSIASRSWEFAIRGTLKGWRTQRPFHLRNFDIFPRW